MHDQLTLALDRRVNFSIIFALITKGLLSDVDMDSRSTKFQIKLGDIGSFLETIVKKSVNPVHLGVLRSKSIDEIILMNLSFTHSNNVLLLKSRDKFYYADSIAKWFPLL